MNGLVKEFAGFGGRMVTADDADYNDRRAVWNGMIDARPALIAVCASTDDVRTALLAARRAELPIPVRGGGHSLPGHSTCADGVVIDLSGMTEVNIDAAAGRARVGGGTTWGAFDARAAQDGLATTGGLIPSTGVGGLTLGGGIGWLQRRYGLACDNLVGAQVVTAGGDVVTTDEDSVPELLWGLRGGGGNFGIVTQFEFALHPVSTVIGGLMLFPLDRGRDVLHAVAEWAHTAPDTATLLAAVLTAPPEPFVPADLVGSKTVAVVGCVCDADPAPLAALRALGPAADLFGPMPYAALQGMLADTAPAGMRNYFRGGFVEDLTDGVIDVVLEHGSRMPSPMSQIHLHQMGGAVARVAADATAFDGRTAGYTFNLISTWADPGEDDEHLAANRSLSADMAAHSMPLSYANFHSDPEGGADAIFQRSTRERLARLKEQWDPDNVFRRNHNVAPGQVNL